MKASIIIAHPYKNSFNHAIYYQAIKTFEEIGIQTYAHDLYDENFNPLLTKDELGKIPTQDVLVQQYLKEVLDSQYLVFIHPNWWGQPPAILKGYIDRVFRSPDTYDNPIEGSLDGIPEGKLVGKIGVVFNTSNTDEERENTYFHDPLEYIWKKCIFGFCGIEETYRKMYRIISDSSNEKRIEWLKETEELILKIAHK